MMGATLANYDAALKETWTQDNLESQIYNGNPFLDDIEKTSRYHVGAQAQTPILTNRNGGYTAAPAAGSTALNAAGNVGSAQALWNYTHHYQQIKIEEAAIVGTESNELAVANVIDTEVSGATDEIRKQLTRQAFSNGDALIAKCTTTTTANLIHLDPTGVGYDAIVRNWLHPGQTVDIGTTSSEATIAGDVVISAVSESSSDPTITVGGSTVSTTTSHFISIANARAGTTSYEMNGLKNIVSATADLGGLTVASNPTWQAAGVDSTTTVLTLDLMYQKQREVMQKTGQGTDYVVMSLVNQERFYKLLQQQARFDGDRNLGAGDVGGVKFANMSINAHNDCPNPCIFWLTKKHLFICATNKPAWQNQTTGGNILTWGQGTTGYVGMLHYHIQLATNRRDAHSAATAITS